MKTLLICEILSPPYDEGMKNFARRTAEALARSSELRKLSDLPSLPRGLNRLLLLPRVFLAGLAFRPRTVIYIPEASLTFLAFVKAALMRLLLARPITLVGLQRRRHAPWQSAIVRLIAPRRLFVLSRVMADELAGSSIRACVLPTGIDRRLFAPSEQKAALRAKYGLSLTRTVLLHVGHIRESRNLRWLIEICRALPEIEIVVVGSTATQQDETLCRDLAAAGVRLYRESLAAIQEIYQSADAYIFPVQKADAAMETPLSVLEAMAVNLPVITTRFGRLPELFEEEACIRYAGSPEDVVDILRAGFAGPCRNREKTEPFDWARTADMLLDDQQN